MTVTLLQRLREGLEPSFNPRGASLFGDECKAVVALVEAAQELCGPGRDGRWVVFADEHVYAVREHLVPALAAFFKDKP